MLVMTNKRGKPIAFMRLHDILATSEFVSAMKRSGIRSEKSTSPFPPLYSVKIMRVKERELRRAIKQAKPKQ
jgi:hypothetical protein